MHNYVHLPPLILVIICNDILVANGHESDVVGPIMLQSVCQYTAIVIELFANKSVR